MILEKRSGAILQARASLEKIKHVALDMDGTIYNGNTLFPFTVDVLEKMKKNGIGYSFLTNNSSKSRSDYLLHLKRMGIFATEDEIYTSGQATIDYLQLHHPDIKRLFILGTPSLIQEFEEAGFVSASDDAADRPDAIIAGFDMTLTYARLCRAAWWVHEELPYIATHPDKICPTDLPTVLVDCGAMCAAIEKATGRKPDVVVGKPDPRMLEGIMYRYDLRPDEVAMIGDRIYTDIAMAKNTKCFGVLVLTGETKEADLKKCTDTPDLLVADLAEFEELLSAAKKR